ncbi:bifunctional glutamate N-acetyltransferase/amino-acid acetyltransferase ArgJ [Campylobacter sp. RM9344]|uniref:Arginine biosynthesis bifunctional protein ArgJ n=1 Tax=Campylobacter californiensis TaxID=1032243 RepID=A0AAW3ZVM8_9BACT|nr:bifunctional glutamate N-acetyltransferase/amino-acid acetyltransferase ArgJ [Campylobacter sp. RM9337]MBE2986091.1 bifunctional glutamate N-acetyltransferase/amino-acid acetyltransferase ArgJ [Campylobacter sp. RM12919]MBE2987504.1 bifunctional glutamate N-acetyltransferase/amino-acid acetyltransferase ArgJ [Campylobacter sp. RM12920]MBE3028775.1 bifunctional glutamate N-acetyltransferase/amino-acid acetyltransferase ArgJ [Campylobacter sp. RM9344]MBE3607664.1 bifunctional glutamate N-acety
MFKITALQNGLENVDGFYFGGVKSGFKKDANDLGFIRSDEVVDVSANFTSNKFRAAPIRHFLKYPKNFKTNFILLNSKNANAMTGEAGVNDIDTLFTRLKETLNLNLVNPIMSSTGVIGYRLNIDKISASFDKFELNSRDSNATVSAIMTTDSFKKELAYEVELKDGSKFKIAAICKGAGMINPAFATMLCFILTDANIPKEDMDELLDGAVKQSFNCVSVDGDTSTNDTVMLLSSRKSNSYNKNAFKEVLNLLTKELSLMLVKDGEGSTKVVEFEVKGAKNLEEAQRAAKALSNSLLVKTAIFGEDPNWGRIASTIGASNVECDEDKLVIFYDDVLLYDKNHKELDKAREADAHAIMQKPNYKISCDLGVGEANFSAYGCDLGHAYVSINADYRS